MKARVTDLANVLGVATRWQVEMAAMLQPIGYITLPPETVERVYAGHVLGDDDKKMIARLPIVTEQLLGHIPRLEDVRAILAGATRPTVRTDTVVELGAAILRVAGDLDDLEARGIELAEALVILRGRAGTYSERVSRASPSSRMRAARSSRCARSRYPDCDSA